jgi:hypothetical protein
MTRLAEELRAVFGVRDAGTPRFQPSAAAIEEEAASRLYGERTGTVNASPASPPLPPAPEHASAETTGDAGQRQAAPAPPPSAG